jgi:hypothetical protein
MWTFCSFIDPSEHPYKVWFQSGTYNLCFWQKQGQFLIIIAKNLIKINETRQAHHVRVSNQAQDQYIGSPRHRKQRQHTQTSQRQLVMNLEAPMNGGRNITEAISVLTESPKGLKYPRFQECCNWYYQNRKIS